MNYIILVGAFQALIAFVLSFMQKRGEAGNALSWLLALIFLHLGGNFIMNTAFPQSETHKEFNTFIALFYGPVLWMYTASLSGAAAATPWRRYLHMLPGILAAVTYLSIAAYTIAHGGKTPAYIWYYNMATRHITLASLAFYAVRSWRQARVITCFWKEERELVKLIAMLFLIICLVWLPFQVAPWFSVKLLPAEMVHYWFRVFVYVMLLLVCLAIVRVKFLVMKYTSTVVPAAVPHSMVSEPEVVVPQPVAEPEQAGKKLLLPVARQEGIAADIHKMMEEAKLFTDPDLTLDSLATAMKVSRNHVSEVLNQHMGKSFYQYINECRIRHVVNLMNRCRKEQVTPNILSLAFDAGFHTKSSFNQYFKKVMGCTPSAYMKAEPDTFEFVPGGLPLREA